MSAERGSICFLLGLAGMDLGWTGVFLVMFDHNKVVIFLKFSSLLQSFFLDPLHIGNKLFYLCFCMHFYVAGLFSIQPDM